MATVVTLDAYCVDCGCNSFEKNGEQYFCSECDRVYLPLEIEELRKES